MNWTSGPRHLVFLLCPECGAAVETVRSISLDGTCSLAEFTCVRCGWWMRQEVPVHKLAASDRGTASR